MQEMTAEQARRTVDDMQRASACMFNLRILKRIADSHYRGDKFRAPEMPAFAAHLVHHAEAGTLSHTDSLILAAYGVATLRECHHAR